MSQNEFDSCGEGVSDVKLAVMKDKLNGMWTWAHSSLCIYILETCNINVLTLF